MAVADSTPISFARQHLCQTPLFPGVIQPKFLPAEVRAAKQTMKTATAAPGRDHVWAELLRAGGHRQDEILAEHLTSYLQKERIPDQWRTFRTILLHKKGDTEDLRN
ncbi:unnamed protein product [Strongylus vulgaris]|uniref:Uncharacterized protein n=1 Tax=Strongylus vulgaris TaxID=40348 RepID=A0A3P7IW05_STRVU|nr:unnamed protein product [Strongylus vulgaris]